MLGEEVHQLGCGSADGECQIEAGLLLGIAAAQHSVDSDSDVHDGSPLAVMR